jgi:hypothetical protein
MLHWRHLSAALVLVIGASANASGSGAHPGTEMLQAGGLADRLTRPQNAERAIVGLRPMAWDPALALAASDYAAELAQTEKWGHSEPDQRPGQGENLWMGTRAAFTPEEMVDGWLTERRIFRRGTFPNVSASGSWHDVGQYTQLIWADTLRVGCAVRSSKTNDYLVCRYSAPGNVMGERVGPVTLASR